MVKFKKADEDIKSINQNDKSVLSILKTNTIVGSKSSRTD